MAAAALIQELCEADDFLSYPSWAATNWSVEEVQLFFDGFGSPEFVPERDRARYTQHLQPPSGDPPANGPELQPEPEPEPQQLPWPWAGGYAVGAQHPLIFGNTKPPVNPQATLRVFCFLWTGGCGSFFSRALAPSFPAGSSIELVPVNLPGRDKDASSLPPASWHAVVSQVTTALSDGGWTRAMPFAFFGHSLGAWTAIEVAHALRQRGPTEPLPVHLFVSAKFAPQVRIPPTIKRHIIICIVVGCLFTLCKYGCSVPACSSRRRSEHMHSLSSKGVAV